MNLVPLCSPFRTVFFFWQQVPSGWMYYTELYIYQNSIGVACFQAHHRIVPVHVPEVSGHASPQQRSRAGDT